MKVFYGLWFCSKSNQAPTSHEPVIQVNPNVTANQTNN